MSGLKHAVFRDFYPGGPTFQVNGEAKWV